MSSLLSLPTEIKTSIFQYVFSDLIVEFGKEDRSGDGVRDNSVSETATAAVVAIAAAAPRILYQPDEVSVNALIPIQVPLFLTSWSLRRDYHLLKTFYSNCTLNLDHVSQSNTFEKWLNQKSVINLFGFQSPFQHLQVTLPVLDNLEKQQEKCYGQAETPILAINKLKSLTILLRRNGKTVSSYGFDRIFRIADDEPIDCSECDPPGRIRHCCREHIRAHPIHFAGDPEKVEVRHCFRTCTTASIITIHKTGMFVAQNFFNDNHLMKEPGPRRRAPNTNWALYAPKTKQAIVQSKLREVTLHCRLTFLDEIDKKRRVMDAEFDTKDWILRYSWAGVKYEIPQSIVTGWHSYEGDDSRIVFDVADKPLWKNGSLIDRYGGWTKKSKGGHEKFYFG